MDPSQRSQIFFREIFTVPTQERVRDLVASTGVGAFANRIVNAMAPGHLVAVLESICARELQSYLDDSEDVVVAGSMQCRHLAPIPPGARVKISGWVTEVADREATFCVQASDEQEIVCEGQIRLTIVERSQIERRLQRKCEAIARRELFTNA